MSSGLPWFAIQGMDGSVDIVPAGDLRDHEEGMGCWCFPCDDEGMTVHNSLDEREKIEPDYLGLDRRAMS